MMMDITQTFGGSITGDLASASARSVPPTGLESGVVSAACNQDNFGESISGVPASSSRSVSPTRLTDGCIHAAGDRALAGLPIADTAVPADSTSTESTYFRIADIARALALDKRVVHRMAESEHWPMHQCGNRFEFCPPPRIAALVIARPDMPKEEPYHNGVKFTDLAHCPAQRDVVLLREKAVQMLLVNTGIGKELALKLVSDYMRREHPLFRCSVNSLRMWVDKYLANGIDGLVEQKRGKVGRKPFAAALTPDMVLKGRAASVEMGINGDGNAARAYRELVADPTLTGEARLHLHGNYASKSYVPPSIRKALEVPVYTRKLIQIGPHEAKLDGPYTECDYSKTPAGKAFTCDDMTANVYIWCEWPNELGYILIRPQILAAMDVGSMSWLTIRAVMRSRGQYNKDDAWGLIGDVFDEYGLYPIAVLEGGIWQSNAFLGEKTSIDDSTRFGGLKSLGVKMIHARTPRAKIIENAFHRLQSAADRCPGYCGRNERNDLPEAVKKQIYMVQHGQAHPSKFFLHFNQYCEHLQKVMQMLNNEEGDGKILRGQSPAQKWAADAPKFSIVPDSAKWMYRSTFNLKQVTRNGVNVTVGSGRYQVSYTYNSIELEAYRGHRVCIFWNDYNPDTAAIIYTMRDGKPHEFICSAERLASVDRFNASEDEMATEQRRKALVHQMAVSQTKSLAPDLQRKQHLIPTGPVQNDIAAKIAAAKADCARREATTAAAKRSVSRLPDVDINELSAPAPTRPTAQMPSMDELNELLNEP